MTKESKCNCQHCDQSIVFPTEMAGQSVECPGCKLETILFVPPPPPKKSHAQSSPIPTIDSAIKSEESWVSKSETIEETLEAIGRVLFFLSILAGGIAILIICMIGFQNPGGDETPNVIGLVIISVVSIANGIIIRAIFRAIAEIIRLLRQLVKLQSDRKTAQSNPT